MEVERGPLKQTPPQRQPQNKPKRERRTGEGCCVGRWAKETLRPRKGIERNTEETWDDHRQQGSPRRGRQTRTQGIGRKKDGEAADRFGHKNKDYFGRKKSN